MQSRCLQFSEALCKFINVGGGEADGFPSAPLESINETALPQDVGESWKMRVPVSSHLSGKWSEGLCVGLGKPQCQPLLSTDLSSLCW